MTEFWPLESGQKGCCHFQTWAPRRLLPSPGSPTRHRQPSKGLRSPGRQLRYRVSKAFSPTAHRKLNPAGKHGVSLEVEPAPGQPAEETPALAKTWTAALRDLEVRIQLSHALTQRNFDVINVLV